MVGLVSARLLAAGTPRHERLHALSLLGLLFDHADAGGKVRVPLDDIVGEFELPPAQAEQALEALVRVQAVRRGADGLLEVGRQPAARGGLRLSAFLANVAVVLDEEHTQPVPASEPRSPVLLAEEAATSEAPVANVGRRRLRPRQPALAALALTAVVLLAALNPGDPPTGLRTVASPPSTATDASTGPDPDGPGSSESRSSTSQPSQTTVGGGEGGTGQDQPSAPSGPEGSEGPDGASAEGGPASPDPDRAAPGPGARRPAATGTDGNTGPPPPGDPVPSTSAPPGPPPAEPGPPAAPPGPNVRCPVRTPEIVVDGITVRPGGPDVVLGVPTTSVTEVQGTLVNPSRASAVIRLFEVTIRFGPETVPVPSSGRVTLPPGQRHQFTLRAARPGVPAPAPTVEAARILDWGWQEAELARSCRP